MAAIILNFREWIKTLEEDANSHLFWVGPLLNDPKVGILTLCHSLKNKMAQSTSISDTFLWSKWKSFFGAADNLQRLSQYNKGEALLPLFRNMQKYFGDIYQYYAKINPTINKWPEVRNILKDLRMAIDELSHQSMATPKELPDRHLAYA